MHGKLEVYASLQDCYPSSTTAEGLFNFTTFKVLFLSPVNKIQHCAATRLAILRSDAKSFVLASETQ